MRTNTIRCRVFKQWGETRFVMSTSLQTTKPSQYDGPKKNGTERASATVTRPLPEGRGGKTTKKDEPAVITPRQLLARELRRVSCPRRYIVHSTERQPPLCTTALKKSYINHDIPCRKSDANTELKRVEKVRFPSQTPQRSPPPTPIQPRYILDTARTAHPIIPPPPRPPARKTCIHSRPAKPVS